MNSNLRTLVFVSMVAAAGGARAADTGTLWHVTTSMSGMGMNMPSRGTDMCVAGSQQNQPPPGGQSDCHYTEVSRSGSTVRYAVQCNTMKGTGEISYSADRYTGKFDMQSSRGDMSVTYEGQRVGTCDAAQANGAPHASGAAQTSSGAQAAAGALSGAASTAASSAVGGAVSPTSSAATGAASTVGSEVKSGIAQGASQVKDAATDVATDAAQSAKDDATQSVKDKAEGMLKGLFGR